MIKLVTILVTLFAGNCMALSPEYRISWEKELRYVISKHIPYVWGAASYQSADCSGYIYATARAAGMPVIRTTALNMANGGGGWTGTTVTVDDADHLTVLWWTWANSARIHGHVGVLLEHPHTGLLQTTHSSGGRGVVLDRVKGRLLTNISKVRVLTIGD